MSGSGRRGRGCNGICFMGEVPPQKVIFTLPVLGFASANTLLPLKQHSQTHKGVNVCTAAKVICVCFLNELLRLFI